MRLAGLAVAIAAAGGFGWGVPAQAQGPVYVDSRSPFFVPAVTNVDSVKVQMPNLAFTPSATDAADYDKYFYFHRPDTDFATAYRDIVECDGYARGLASGVAPMYRGEWQEGWVGAMLSDAIADAIYGSANRRKMRRANMRACMNFKGYDRYGLSKEVWTVFNFEEGNKMIPEDVRTGFLMQQALVASSARPEGKTLGL